VEDIGPRSQQSAHVRLVRPRLSWQRGVAALWRAALIFMVCQGSATADPLSDFFQPDFFRTGPALAQRTPGLNDPLGRDCTLPAGPLSLAAAVDLALCRNPSTRSAWASARQQAAAMGSAESAWLPGIAVTGMGTREYGTHEDTTGAYVSTPQNTGDAAANLT
jgi:outer membrane protein